jgi:hypothetical protein
VQRDAQAFVKKFGATTLGAGHDVSDTSHGGFKGWVPAFAGMTN